MAGLKSGEESGYCGLGTSLGLERHGGSQPTGLPLSVTCQRPRIRRLPCRSTMFAPILPRPIIPGCVGYLFLGTMFFDTLTSALFVGEPCALEKHSRRPTAWAQLAAARQGSLMTPPSTFGSDGSDCSSNYHGRGAAPPCPRAPEQCAEPAPCPTRRPTGRTNLCSR